MYTNVTGVVVRNARWCTLFVLFCWTGVLSPTSEGALSESTPSTSASVARTELVGEIKAYQRGLGWNPTENFLRYDDAFVAYSYCVYTGEFDFARSVTWDDKDGCPEKERHDRSFGAVEAVAGSGVPLSRSLVEADLARFVYVVFHEDFHEQIAMIPTMALNESATQLVGLYAAEGFLREKYGMGGETYRAFAAAIDAMLRTVRIEREYVERLSKLYERVTRGEVGRGEGLREKARLYEELRRTCKAFEDTGLYLSCAQYVNNADLSTALLYSAHYELFHEFHRCFRGDVIAISRALTRLVAEEISDEEEFIRRVKATIAGGCR